MKERIASLYFPIYINNIIQTNKQTKQNKKILNLIHLFIKSLNIQQSL